MKVYLAPRADLSQGIHRVAQALRTYAPDWATVVDDPEQADFRIGHVIGIHGMQEWVARGPYALIQYCYSTAGGSTDEWQALWADAKAVWSYYDLRSVCPRFLHRPLGVGRIFQPSVPARKRFIIGTSGYVADTECVMECYGAAQAVGAMQFHLGPNLNFGPGVIFAHGIPDAQVAEFWSQCSFVAGLRRCEGFELPALEGLMCGARPVMFDAPHYRQWFNDFAEFIPEGSPREVEASLTELFSRPVRPVTAIERAEAARRFNWKQLATEFWEALR